MMAGGTGGHIYPALAVAHLLKAKGYQVSWLGSVGGMEQELVAREGFEIFLLPVSGVRGKGKLALLKAPFTLMACIWKARAIFKQKRIDLAVGFGGFASGPGGLASYLTGCPLLIHEQNAVAGMTNKVLSKLADIVCEAFPNVFSGKKVRTTGNPIRKSLVELNKAEKTGANKSLVNVLVIGGSRGAKVFNDELPDVLAELVTKNLIAVKHQTGKNNLKSVELAYKNLNNRNVEASEYIHDMDEVYAWANIVICRAGALTVSEVATVGVAAIFVPYPYAVDDHQTKNAEYLTKQGAGELVQQTEIKKISSILNDWLGNKEQINKMADAAKTLAKNSASEEITKYCESLLVRKAV